MVKAAVFLLLCGGTALAAQTPPPPPAPAGAANPPVASKSFEEVQNGLLNVCGNIHPHLPTKHKVKSINLLQEPDVVNAWADFNGKVTFTTAMMDFLKNDDEVAVICGHEMAHITAGHLKRSIGQQILGGVVGAAIGGDGGDIVGAAVVMKQSRSHEREADERGLYAMWQAGYNPMTGVDLWQRMSKEFGGKNIPFLSSHPASEERLTNMKVLMVKGCLGNEELVYCDRILADPDYKAAYDGFK